MKNYFLKLTTLLCISLALFSCDQEDDANANQDNNQTEETADCNFELDFKFLQGEDYVTAVVNDIEGATYAWSVNEFFYDGRKDGQPKQDPTEENEKRWNFNPQEIESVEFCVEVKGANCEQAVELCKTIKLQNAEINNGCDFELAFEMTELQDGQIKLTAIKGVEGVGYSWKVNGDFINASGKEVTIDWIDGKSEICLFQETPDCPNGKSTCQVYAPNGSEDNGEGNEVGSKCLDLIELSIDFIAGLDMNIKNVHFHDIGNYDFQWTVNGNVESAVVGEDGPYGAPNGSLYWGPRVGETEFCFTLFTDDCPNGISKCITYVQTQETISIANTSVNGELPELVVVKREDGKYTLGTK